jgi:hypothetical protein
MMAFIQTLGLSIMAFLFASAVGQTPRVFTKADSGWVSLFNGKDFTGLYIRTNGGLLQNPVTQKSFAIEGDVLHVPATGGVGHIATRSVFGHYAVRVQYKFGKGQNSPNAGLLYHIEPTDFQEANAWGTKNAGVPYFAGAYVKSVEYQMYRGDAGAFLGIMNIWVTAETKGDGNHTYQPGGTLYTAYPSAGLAERRIYRSINAAPNDTDWVQFEGLIYGADSVTHQVNGTTVMKGRSLKHNQKLQITTQNDVDQVPMNEGHIGLQTEGAEVFYRNWEIRILGMDGKPIIPGCMNSGSGNFNPLANKDNGSCQVSRILVHALRSSISGDASEAFSVKGQLLKGKVGLRKTH